VLIVVLPLSETTDFLTDQIRTLISLLRTLRSLPTKSKQDFTESSAEEIRRKYLEQAIAKKLSQAGLMNNSGDMWNEQKERYEKIGSLEDLRKLEGR